MSNNQLGGVRQGQSTEEQEGMDGHEYHGRVGRFNDSGRVRQAWMEDTRRGEEQRE